MYMFKVMAILGAFALGILAGCATGQQNSNSNTIASQTSTDTGVQEESSDEPANPNEGYKDPKTGKIVTKDGRVLVCKKETPTGSNLPRKVCRWKRDKDAQTLREQNDVRDIQRRSSIIQSSGH